MIHIRPGSQAGSLLSILSVVGEYPYSSLRLLGNERCFRMTVHKLSEKQVLYNSESGERLTCRALSISGKGSGKILGISAEMRRFSDCRSDSNVYADGNGVPSVYAAQASEQGDPFCHTEPDCILSIQVPEVYWSA